MTTVEQWRAIPGYEGTYEVSNMGRVRGLARRVSNGQGGTRKEPARLRRTSLNSQGYAVVNLRLNSKARTWRVHQLVAFAFLGPRMPGMQVCHNNGDPSDPRLSNLRYGTAKENAADRVLHETYTLTLVDVRAIRASDAHYTVLAKRYGVTGPHIQNIQARRVWSHIP